MLKLIFAAYVAIAKITEKLLDLSNNRASKTKGENDARTQGN